MKKKYPSTNPKEWPPDIFWISPDGGVIPAIGHVSAIQWRPREFGLHTAPQTQKEISDTLDGLWDQGWVRGRFVDGTFYFHMARPRGRTVGSAYDMVTKYSKYADRVSVDFADPFYFKFAKDFTAGEFLMQEFPVSWQLNPRRRR